jgi:two-component system cell cycle sensor histidine kinase/response regulator CckA
VVDDEDIIRSLMKRTLESAGYTVLLARNGRDALDALERHRGRVDVVLSDLVMPVMDGRELGHRLAVAHPDIPVVWMSGHPKETMLVTGTGIELEPFLQKPVPAELLVTTVADVLERVRQPTRGSSPNG